MERRMDGEARVEWRATVSSLSQETGKGATGEMRCHGSLHCSQRQCGGVLLVMAADDDSAVHGW